MCTTHACRNVRTELVLFGTHLGFIPFVPSVAFCITACRISFAMVNGLLSDMEEEASLYHVTATVPNVPIVKEGSKRTETLSTSKNQSSYKLMQIQRARPRSKESAAVKTKKRKIAARSAEDEATSLTNNRHVHTAGAPIIQTTLDGNLRMKSMSVSRNAISRKIVEKAVSVSRAVSRKRSEQAVNNGDGTLSPENEVPVCIQSCLIFFSFVV